MRFNEIDIDVDAKSVRVHQYIVNLAPKEYALLYYLLINQNKVLPKRKLAEYLLGQECLQEPNYSALYTHIKNLRKKIQLAGGNDYIKLVYSSGYTFTDR